MTTPTARTTGHDTQAVATRLVTYPAVTGTMNGSNTATSVLYHYAYAAGGDLYYNDWTQHEDGTYSYTELGTGGARFGQVVKTIEDVNTNAFNTNFPSGWTGTTSGANLVTTFDYYDGAASPGLLKSVTAAGGRTSVYAYMCQSKTGQSDGARRPPLSLVTLMAPCVLANVYGTGGDCGFEQVTVTDLAGRTIFSGEGVPSTTPPRPAAKGCSTTGIPSQESPLWGDAYQASPVSGAVSTYNSYNSTSGAGKLASMARYYDVDYSATHTLTTTYAYNSDSGLLDRVQAPDGTVTMTRLRPGRPRHRHLHGHVQRLAQTCRHGEPRSRSARRSTMRPHRALCTTSGAGDGNVTASLQLLRHRHRPVLQDRVQLRLPGPPDRLPGARQRRHVPQPRRPRPHDHRLHLRRLFPEQRHDHGQRGHPRRPVGNLLRPQGPGLPDGRLRRDHRLHRPHHDHELLVR